MPWKQETCMSLRKEFVSLARSGVLPFSQLCQRFEISRKTGYKWLSRASVNPAEDFSDRSRRPHHSPCRTPVEIEEQVLALRRQHPVWGGRKIASVLQTRGLQSVPAPSTVTHILHRHGLIEPRVSGEGGTYRRFEHERPNRLWQMDFKGYFQTAEGRCDPLTVLDDHSRFNIVLDAQQGTSTIPVQTALQTAFRRYGLPQQMNMDNGQPWGSPRSAEHGLSTLSAWLVRLGIHISFSRPAHPQTNGKDERFHRTLKAEVLLGNEFDSLSQVQQRFNGWREIYNHLRPHEGIGMAVPAERYEPSTKLFPEELPPIVYAPEDLVRKVQSNGRVSFKGLWVLTSKGLRGQPVAFRPRPQEDGVYDIYYCQHCFKTINLRELSK